MNTIAFGTIVVCLILGTGLIGALVAAWDVGNVEDAFGVLYSMGILYTLADVAYVVGIS